MTAAIKNQLVFFAALLAITVVAAVLWAMPWLLLLPSVLILLLLIAHRPVFLFYVLLAFIPWSIEFQFNPELGTDLPDEPLMILTSMAGVAVLLYYRRMRPLAGIGSITGLLLLLQLVWICICSVTSDIPLLSLKYLLAKGWYLGAFLVVPFLVFQKKERLLRSGRVLTVSMCALVLLTMVRHSLMGFRFDTINPSLAPFFRNHVNYSALLVCILPLIIWFRRSSEKVWEKRLWTLMLVVAAVALYFSYARGAWLAVFTGGAAYWLLRKKMIFLAYLFFLSALSIGLWWLISDSRYLRFAHDHNTTIFHTDFREHLRATYEFKDVSTAERFNRWIAGVRMVPEKPLTGFGPNSFNRYYRPYTVPAFRTWVSANEENSTVHNYFLLTAIEQGIPGLLILFLLLGYFFYRCGVLYHLHPDPFWRGAIALAVIVMAMLCTVNFLSDLVETDKLGSIYFLCFAVLLVAEKKYRGGAVEHFNSGLPLK